MKKITIELLTKQFPVLLSKAFNSGFNVNDLEYLNQTKLNILDLNSLIDIKVKLDNGRGSMNPLTFITLFDAVDSKRFTIEQIMYITTKYNDNVTRKLDIVFTRLDAKLFSVDKIIEILNITTNHENADEIFDNVCRILSLIN